MPEDPNIAFCESWTDALETVRDAIIDAIGTTYATVVGGALEADENFHLDFLPAQHSVVALFSGGGGNEQAQTFDDEVAHELIMSSRIIGRFRTRDMARKIAMLMVKALPIHESDKVNWFRVTGEPAIETDVVRLANDKEEKRYWTFELPCQLVFKTSASY
jgi:hypothetical protein